MKKIDSKGKSSVRYIGKGVIIVSLITTSSLAFLLGFFVGKNEQPPAVNQAPVVAPATAPENTDSLKRDVVPQGPQQSPEAEQRVQPDVQTPQPAQATPQPVKTEPANQSEQMKESDKDEAVQETAGTKKYTVQAGAFRNASEASILKAKLHKKGYNASVSPAETKKHEKLYRVLVGEFSKKSEAELLAVRIKKTEGLRAFAVVRNQEALRSQ
jgi:cell division septation protein DedD